jgi:tetratricopeptide (TPR) repeat protein
VKPVLRYALDAGLIALLCALLYVPYLGNPLVFDDRIFFSGQRFAEYATTPFGFDLRLPPYFTLAFTEVVWGGRIEAHRIWSLVIHIACALLLYRLLLRLLRGESGALALLGAAIFAIHPVAVYGAGYLVQRSILFATLFSLLSIFLFVRGLSRGRHADALSAALMYWLAIFSKEHSILLPAAALLAIPIAVSDRRFAIRHAALYLLACAPAAIVVVLRVKWLIGSAYEPAFDAVTAQIEAGSNLDVAGSPWLASAVTQMGLFFKYLAFWLAPSTGSMSIDIRVDFAGTSSAGWMVLKVLAFLGYGACGFLLLRRGGGAAVIGFGMLYPWILFLVELTSVRFQEPFVLYRSYLWAPGIIVALTAALTYLPRKLALALLVAAMPVLAIQARDRLETFSSPLALWEDAAAKLPPHAVPGGYRTLFQLGRELLYSDQADKAIATANRCMAEYPRTPQCYLARGSIHLFLEQYAEALPYLTRALELDPGSGITRHHRGVALEKLGRVAEAREE